MATVSGAPTAASNAMIPRLSLLESLGVALLLLFGGWLIVSLLACL